MKKMTKTVSLGTAFASLALSSAALVNMQGCSMLDSVPGGDMISSALGLDIPFKISGAPTDEVLAVIWYAERTNTMLAHFDKTGRDLAREFARTFDIKVNAETDESMAALNAATANIEAGNISAEQKQWLEKNAPLMMGWGFALETVASSSASFAVSLPDALSKISSDPVKYSGTVLANARSVKSDLEEAFDRAGPAVESFLEVGPSFVRIFEAAGVTPPTPEQERAEGMKLTNESLPAGEEVEFS